MAARALGVARDLRRPFQLRPIFQGFDDGGYRPDSFVVERVRKALLSILFESTIPFWFPNCLDEQDGGFHLVHDRAGQFLQASSKHHVGQAAMLWFLARMVNSEYRSEEFRVWADHGMAFLRSAFWDHREGGFFWEVDARGQVLKDGKHLYSQAFGLFALSEYALATGDVEAEEMSRALFALLEEKAHDQEFGGYCESFSRDWRALPCDSISLMGVPSRVKQFNTHVHLLEAMTRYVQLVDEPLVRRRVAELVAIQSRSVVRNEWMSGTDWHHRDWRPYGAVRARANYGHDVENAWLLIEADRALGRGGAGVLETSEALFRTAVRYGWDCDRGGFFRGGRLGKTADQRDHVWWAQAEGLVCALWLYVLTGKRGYFDVFERTLTWIVDHQLDHAYGEWFMVIGPDMRPIGEKASDVVGAWKTPYHGGRAVLTCLELLQRV